MPCPRATIWESRIHAEDELRQTVRADGEAVEDLGEGGENGVA
jgi:hypothetical protein